jgi:hypothetical protein
VIRMRRKFQLPASASASPPSSNCIFV